MQQQTAEALSSRAPVYRSERSRPSVQRPAGTGERGIALVTTLIIMSVILFLGTFALVSSRSEIRTSANYRGRLQAQYFAESGIDEIVGYQNDLTASPRYLFNPAKYTRMASDSSVLNDLKATDPKTGKQVGTIHRVILDKNPAAEPPPYRLRTTATMNDGSQAEYEVEVNALSLLDFAMYAEGSLGYVTPGMWLGRTYVNGNISIWGDCSTPEIFMKKVEYTGNLSGAPCGDFREGSFKILPYPPLTSLVDLGYYENAGTKAGYCGDGIGLYIGVVQGPGSVQDQSRSLFLMEDVPKPGVENLASISDWSNSKGEAVNGCMNAAGCYQIDLTLFDFAADTVTYGGIGLLDVTGAKLLRKNFNGVIYVDGELHVWGILGGRSTEDRVVVDSITSYDATFRRPTDVGNLNPGLETIGTWPRGKPFHHHPRFSYLKAPYNGWLSNRYSNNALDAGEDANGNGILDPARKGTNLTVVTPLDDDIIVDHNIHYGTDRNGNRVSLGLLSGDAIFIDANSPRMLVATGAMLARGSDNLNGWNGSFVALPNNDQTTHRLNFWAKAGGDSNPADSTYVYDMNGTGMIETNIGQGLAGDRNETSMRAAWANLALGNNVTAAGASWGPWVTTPHAGTKIYDFDLLAAEPPCWPVLPYYGTVSGSFTETRN
ncbi:MAG: pilus assembly PilX N-terminal domain-containing protein [Gemmatimonadetes bacterium]|nr:pilus assembly PilX N-terminal domain-containing protein [Gemmatimonadota bacterium]